MFPQPQAEIWYVLLLVRLTLLSAADCQGLTLVHQIYKESGIKSFSAIIHRFLLTQSACCWSTSDQNTTSAALIWCYETERYWEYTRRCGERRPQRSPNSRGGRGDQIMIWTIKKHGQHSRSTSCWFLMIVFEACATGTEEKRGLGPWSKMSKSTRLCLTDILGKASESCKFWYVREGCSSEKWRQRSTIERKYCILSTSGAKNPRGT